MKPCLISASKRRSGAALIELLVVISVSSVIVGIGVFMISLLLKSERDVALGARYAAALSRLTGVLRDDIHQAGEARITAETEPSRLELQLADQHVVEYVITGNRIDRKEQRDGTVIHQDSFLFPAESQLQFAQDPEPQFIRLVLELSNRPSSLPRRTIVGQPRPTRVVEISAALARDQRFSGRTP